MTAKVKRINVASTSDFLTAEEAGVFLDINGRDWVHYDAELDHSSLLVGTNFIPDHQTAPVKQ